MTSRRFVVAVACGLACASPIDDESTWIEVQTEHIRLFSTGWPELAIEMAERLELFHMVGKELLDTETLEERLPTYVYLLDDRLWYSALGQKQNSLGVLVPHPHANYMTLRALGNRKEVLRLAQNLYVRVLQQTRASDEYPRWYETGIGELLSTVEVREDHVLIGRLSAFRRGRLERGFQERNHRGVHRGAPRSGTWVPFRTVMRARSEKSWPRDHRYMFYAESRALAFYLSWKYSAELALYLELVRDGQTHDQAFETAFDLSHFGLEQQIERFFWGRERLWRIPAERFEVRADPKLRTLAPPEWNALLGELLNARRLPDQSRLAEQSFERALDGTPDLTQAHAGLATALAIQGKRGGDDHIERALELEPDDAHTRLYAGEYFLSGARSGAEVDTQRLARARSELARALELAPDLPGAYYALGQTYLLAGEDPRLAIDPLERAHALMAWQRDVALALGEAHVLAGQSERARELLSSVALATHNERTRKRAEELLAELDSPGDVGK